MTDRGGAKPGKRASADALFRVGGWAADMLLLAVLLGAVCLFVLYPILCIFLRSFQGGAGLNLDSYRAVWSQYRTNLWNSLFVGVLTALFCTIFSVAAALFLSTKRGWVKLICMGLLLITMVSPPFVSSLAASTPSSPTRPHMLSMSTLVRSLVAPYMTHSRMARTARAFTSSTV